MNEFSDKDKLMSLPLLEGKDARVYVERIDKVCDLKDLSYKIG